MKRKVKKYVLELKRFLQPKYTSPFLVTLFVFLCIKSYVFDVAIVRSPAMNNTLKEGEMVFVAKLFTVKQNDLVRLSLPLTYKDSGISSSYAFKRVIGLPGDTVEVRNANVWVNGKILQENELFLHNYIAKINSKADTTAFVKAEIENKYLIDDSCVYMVSLTEKKFTQLKEQKIFFSLTSNSEDSADYDSNVFPNDNQFKWNKDYFGPLYIPKKGDTLKLDTNSLKIYKRIIVDFENNTLELKNDEILVNEIETAFYVAQKNYYFVTGDNFDSSIDSRHWGFVPEKRIKSKVVFNK